MIQNEISVINNNNIINTGNNKYKLPQINDMICAISSKQLQYIIQDYGKIPSILKNTKEWIILESEYNTKSCNYYWGVNGDYSVVLIHKDFNIYNPIQFIIFGSK